MKQRRSLWFSILGLSFAVAGADKLFSQRGYQAMFRNWGWTEKQMQSVGIAELVGGVLVAPAATRTLGGMVLLAACSAVLSEELRHAEARHGGPRLALLLAAATALYPRPAR